MPSIGTPSTSLGHVHPLGVDRTIIGHIGRDLDAAARAPWLEILSDVLEGIVEGGSELPVDIGWLGCARDENEDDGP